ncbi:unnamed protein product [Adineta steineri]|uniref:Fas-associated factor 1/2-like UAS domain-containing protein n=1 Tax=Adineta steineri TaxID=433720 RepID=A0A815Q152_9BILA|nr:unnamed protein product [Adineta steineri]
MATTVCNPDVQQKHMFLISDNCSDEITGLKEFKTNFYSRFGASCPKIRYLTLCDAIQDVADSSKKAAFDSEILPRALFIYLHDDNSDCSDFFCQQILCNSNRIPSIEHPQTYFWPWDLTFQSNREKENIQHSSRQGVPSSCCCISVLNFVFYVSVSLVAEDKTNTLNKIKSWSNTTYPYVIRLWFTYKKWNGFESPEIQLNIRHISGDQILHALYLNSFQYTMSDVIDIKELSRSKVYGLIRDLLQKNQMNPLPNVTQESMQFSYRVVGFPCDIDAGKSHDEKIDLTWMVEDVSAMTTFLQQWGLPGIESIAEEVSQGEYEKHRHTSYPASIVPDRYEEIQQLFGTKYTKTSNFCSIGKGSNGVHFVYITGHGLSERIVSQLKNREIKIDDIHRKIKIISDHDAYQEFLYDDDHNIIDHKPKFDLDNLDPGDIIGYTQFISFYTLINEFMDACLKISRNEPTLKLNKHLVIVVDSCYSGNWINTPSLYGSSTNPLAFTLGPFRSFQNGTNISITIQTSAGMDDTSESFGYYFTPLFVKLQQLSEKKLSDLIDGKYEQQPKFYRLHTIDTNDGSTYYEQDNIADTQFIYHNDQVRLRFFNNGAFFTFFANQFKSLIEILPDTKNLGEWLKPRPVMNTAETDRFFALLKKNSNTIRGMKLMIYDDGQPGCIACVHFKQKQRNEWFHLHVHFNGSNPFPGEIVNLKVYVAEERRLTAEERRQNKFTEDASCDSEDDKQKTLEDGRLRWNGYIAQEPELYMDGWQQYKNDLFKILKNWADDQESNTRNNP